MTHHWKLLGILAALVIGTLVGSLALAADGPAAPRPAVAAEPLFGSLAGLTFPPSSNLTASQELILRDGRVTDDEMRAAVASTLACIEAAGLRVDIPPSGDPSERVERTFRVITGGPGSPSAVVFACKGEYMDAVDRAFGQQESTRAGLTHSQQLAIYDGCMAEKGFPVADPKRGPTQFFLTERYTEILEAGGMDALNACSLTLKQARRGAP